jgi:hypothetical protein
VAGVEAAVVILPLLMVAVTGEEGMGRSSKGGGRGGGAVVRLTALAWR